MSSRPPQQSQAGIIWLIVVSQSIGSLRSKLCEQQDALPARRANLTAGAAPAVGASVLAGGTALVVAARPTRTTLYLVGESQAAADVELEASPEPLVRAHDAEDAAEVAALCLTEVAVAPASAGAAQTVPVQRDEEIDLTRQEF